MYEMSDRRLPTLGFIEYLVKLFDTANREHEYSRTLLKLFQLYYSAGKYGQAGETLDRAAELILTNPAMPSAWKCCADALTTTLTAASPTGFTARTISLRPPGCSA